MMEVRCITEEAEFSQLEKPWNELLHRSPADNPFLTHQWLHSWWQAFGRGSPLYILACYEKNTAGGTSLVGILPGYVAVDWFLPARRLRLLGSEVVTSDFLDVIVPVGREEQVFSALLAGLRRDRSFHLVELTDLREGSLLRISGNPICHSGWCRREWTVEKICPSLPLPPDPAVYFSRLSRSVRKNFQYYRRRLENQGATLEIIREEEDLARALIDFSRLHGSRRRQKGQHGIFASEAQNAFYSDVLVRFFRAGWLELAFLNVAGVRVAGVCQFNYGDAVYYYQTGYDVSWEKSSVGFVLNGLLIERAILQGKSSYEFLRGAEEYKVRLGATHQSRLEDLYLVNGRLLGEMFVAYRRCSRAGRKVARELLDKALGSRMAGAKAGR